MIRQRSQIVTVGATVSTKLLEFVCCVTGQADAWHGTTRSRQPEQWNTTPIPTLSTIPEKRCNGEEVSGAGSEH